jgi:cell division GTPase FtsZ
MNIFIIGVGQGGDQITDALFAYEIHTHGSFITDVLAVNTAKADLLGLEHINFEH